MQVILAQLPTIRVLVVEERFSAFSLRQDMKAISVSSAGAAKRIALGISSASSMVDYVVAELTSAVSLAASDQINLGTFSVILKDPT